MKIALVSPYDFAYPGGVTSHITSLAQEFLRRGHQVKILAPRSGGRGAADPSYFVPLGRTVPVPSGGSVARISFSVWLGRRVRRLLERERFDVIHLHEPLAPYLPLLVLHFSRSVNIGTFHAYHGSNRWYRWTGPILEQWVGRLHGRIAVSSAAAEFVRCFFPGEYEVIPNGIDVEHFAQELPPFREFCDGKVNILFVGRLEKRKGLRYLLGAFARLKWDYPNLRLLVVGPGRIHKDYWQLLSERNVEDVVFVGGVPYRDLPRYYRTADLCCFPATGKESFGIVLLEAMAAGKPIVASDIEGFRCVVRPGEQALLVPPQDEEALARALETLVLRPELRQELGACGRRTVEAYRWERVADQVLAYYQRVLARSRAPTVQEG